VKCPDQR